ncbi:phosphorylase b kinase gamma catalytic chain, skeletal muscle/heart isoform isoform X2 [Anastrepha ludens]|uniref:phosphorylase b kinase gamma catalytic chain, skeletal muscle/heart isoform isoform X2 n=1 Tax=Anastrepha ludens TaxID=28586 RepID=UPI0023B1342A|nr:phosphorylase b kinase gamma catalytic chain, skeletal muscle/heart isoform isoform X2 [Anastrepha ludens]
MAKDEEEDDVLPDKDAAKGFYAKYEPKEILGRGISSTVRRCIEKETGKEFAAKIIDLGAATEAGDTNPYHMLEATRQEISILRQVMGHPYIIDLQDVFESDAFVFLVFELCPKGELFDYLTSVVTLSEKKTRTIMRQIFEGVEYIHSKNIVHRDLKPENILLDENHNVKITDFGFARQLKGDEKLADLCGTPGYLAPETLKCNMFEGSPGYSKEVDIWACGVIMFTLLVGCPPFWHRKQMVMLRNIMEGKYSFTSPEWADISEDPKDLIRKCLVVDPAKRITVKEVLKHPFFNQMVLCPESSSDGRTTYHLKSQNIRNTLSNGNQLFYHANFNKTRTSYSNNIQHTPNSNYNSNNNNRISMTNLYLSKQANNHSNTNTPSTTSSKFTAAFSNCTANNQQYNNNYNQSNYQSNGGNMFINSTAGPDTFSATKSYTSNSIGNAAPTQTPTPFAMQEQQQQQQLYRKKPQQQQQQQAYEQQVPTTQFYDHHHNHQNHTNHNNSHHHSQSHYSQTQHCHLKPYLHYCQCQHGQALQVDQQASQQQQQHDIHSLTGVSISSTSSASTSYHSLAPSSPQQRLMLTSTDETTAAATTTSATTSNSLSHCCVESLNYDAQLRKQSRFNARKKFQFAILVIRAMIRIRRLRYTAEPLRVEEAIRDPYRVKVLRKVIDGCAFRVYGHWVKKGEGQNRAALFENTPRTELHALYINNLSR